MNIQPTQFNIRNVHLNVHENDKEYETQIKNSTERKWHKSTCNIQQHGVKLSIHVRFQQKNDVIYRSLESLVQVDVCKILWWVFGQSNLLIIKYDPLVTTQNVTDVVATLG